MIQRPEREDKIGGAIQMERYSDDPFSIFGFSLNTVCGNVLLIQYADTVGDGDDIMRNGIVISVDVTRQCWRIGKVILAGDLCTEIKAGDFVCFPNDMGVDVSRIEVTGHGTIDRGRFINEERVFGTCSESDK